MGCKIVDVRQLYAASHDTVYTLEADVFDNAFGPVCFFVNFRDEQVYINQDSFYIVTKLYPAIINFAEGNTFLLEKLEASRLYCFPNHDRFILKTLMKRAIEIGMFN